MLSTRANLALALPGASVAELDALLDGAGLGGLADRRAGDLSGGERRRLEVTRTLARRPALLILDEPLAAVDIAAAATIRDLVAQAVQGGAGLIWAEHADGAPLGPADRTIGLQAGALVG